MIFSERSSGFEKFNEARKRERWEKKQPKSRKLRLWEIVLYPEIPEGDGSELLEFVQYWQGLLSKFVL